MEHQTNSNVTSARRSGLPLAGWVALAGLIAAIVAIFVFNVAVGTVLTYGVIGLIFFGHLFMHGGHGSHSSHDGSTTSPSDTEAQAEQKNKHTDHSGGCH